MVTKATAGVTKLQRGVRLKGKKSFLIRLELQYGSFIVGEDLSGRPQRIVSPDCVITCQELCDAHDQTWLDCFLPTRPGVLLQTFKAVDGCEETWTCR